MKKSIRILILSILFLTPLSSAQSEKIWAKFSGFQTIKLSSFLSKIDYSKLPDDHIQKFVWVNKPFNNVNYEPSDLVPLQWRSHISAQARHTFRKEAADALEKMANDFYSEFWKFIQKQQAFRIALAWATKKRLLPL